MICFDCVTIKRSRQDVIDNVTLTIDAGEAVAFVGESGAGKSSLLLALASVLPLHRGDITVDNLSVRTNAAAVRGRVGYVPACLSAWPAMQATEFLQLFAISAGLCGKPLRSAIDKALALAGMDSSGKQTVDSLCSGQAKRLLIARALLHDPPVLIFDDPFSGLDYKERILVEQIISDAVIMNRIVVAAVDNAVVPRCFTQVALLSKGRLVESGPAVPETFGAGDSERHWGYRIICPSHSETAVKLLRRLCESAHAVDGDTLDCRHNPRQLPFSELVAVLVRAGIAVESAGFYPHWTVQLLT
ncbi:MAG: ABC transporter ATP-binding protein [Planctomycetota bacterium]|nr:MAG: ABC transporter ATP-binding protein [Planctomycetota bacterium]